MLNFNVRYLHYEVLVGVSSQCQHGNKYRYSPTKRNGNELINYLQKNLFQIIEVYKYFMKFTSYILRTEFVSRYIVWRYF